MPSLEKRALASKLAQDWGSGSPRVQKTLPLPGPYQEKVLATKMLGSVFVIVFVFVYVFVTIIVFVPGEGACNEDAC